MCPEGVSIKTCAACVLKVFPCGHVLNLMSLNVFHVSLKRLAVRRSKKSGQMH